MCANIGKQRIALSIARSLIDGLLLKKKQNKNNTLLTLCTFCSSNGTVKVSSTKKANYGG